MPPEYRRMGVGMKKAFRELISDKSYLLIMLFAAAGGYGYALTHAGIGMDDTAVLLYFQDGVAPYVGRWTLFLAAKFLRIADYAPFFTDFAGVILLVLSVTLWCALWKELLDRKRKLPNIFYGFVGAVFLSCPLISEVFVYYLHNGVCMSYGITAISLYYFISALREADTAVKIRRMGISAAFLSVAVGCYESFLMVFVMGALTYFLLLHVTGREQGNIYRISAWILGGVGIVILTLILRAAALWLTELFYEKESLSGYDVLYRQLFGDNLKELSILGMTLKRFVSLYYLHGFMYLPIKVLVCSVFFISAVSLIFGIRKRNPAPVAAAAVIVILPAVMAVVEGNVTKYRSAQYVPLITAFAVLLLLSLIWPFMRGKKTVMIPTYILLGALVFNQCSDMNKWFYVDDLKYQDAKEVMYHVADDLERSFDSSKPVVFVGAYDVPSEIKRYGCVSYSSKEFQWICRLTNPFDEHWKEKYYTPEGYCYAETPLISVLAWGMDAFNHTAGQTTEFFSMHGRSLICVNDTNVIKEARELAKELEMPGYPKDGYIREFDDYIIINMTK